MRVDLLEVRALDVARVEDEGAALGLVDADAVPRSVLGLSPRRAATMAFVTRFLAPSTWTVPRSGRPPRIARISPSPPFRPPVVAVSPSSVICGASLCGKGRHR
ncbi:MAG: hypothetical protein K0Q58_265 [Microbacterium sp.]|nr:hypothetical protein [Microbacterium sp.]